MDPRYKSFSEAVQDVLEMLENQLPGSLVFVGHLDDGEDRFRIIDSRGDASFGLTAGTEVDLSESFCIRMATGEAPNLSNNVPADPVYGALEATDDLDIGSYAGVPLELDGGSRVGSLCAVTHGLNAYSDGDLQLLGVLAKMLAFQLERDRAQRDLEAVMHQLREQARSDPLTALLNRRSFDEGLDRELALTHRDGIPSYLVLFDLDGFKQVNDEYGHAAGDRLLMLFAEALRDAARATDLVARLGGDEFAVVLVRALQSAAPERFVARVRASLAAHNTAEIRFSAGHVALAACESPDVALEAADSAMYENKRERRGTLKS